MRKHMSGSTWKMDQDLLALYHLNDELTLCGALSGRHRHQLPRLEFGRIRGFIGGYFSMSASEVEDLLL